MSVVLFEFIEKSLNYLEWIDHLTIGYNFSDVRLKLLIQIKYMVFNIIFLIHVFIYCQLLLVGYTNTYNK